jgi:hypothetical protein
MQLHHINGRDYFKIYAWYPIKCTNGEIAWFTWVYIRYSRSANLGMLIMQWQEYLIDLNQQS